MSPLHRTAAIAIVMVLPSCGGIASTPIEIAGDEVAESVAESAAESFDLALVKSVFTEGCADSRIDEAFCEEVDIDRWKARGMTLVVPTTLANAEEDTARSMCLVIQDARFEDPEGSRLGFSVIAVQGDYGFDLYTCWKPRF